MLWGSLFCQTKLLLKCYFGGSTSGRCYRTLKGHPTLEHQMGPTVASAWIGEDGWFDQLVYLFGSLTSSPGAKPIKIWDRSGLIPVSNQEPALYIMHIRIQSSKKCGSTFMISRSDPYRKFEAECGSGRIQIRIRNFVKIRIRIRQFGKYGFDRGKNCGLGCIRLEKCVSEGKIFKIRSRFIGPSKEIEIRKAWIVFLGSYKKVPCQQKAYLVEILKQDHSPCSV